VGSIGGAEILIVLLVALIVLGPNRLPQAARQLGKAMGEFRRMTSGLQAELRDTINMAEPAPTRPPHPQPDQSTDQTPDHSTDQSTDPT